MNLPLILIALDDASIGVFNHKKYLISAVEAPDIDNYRVFDKDGVELRFNVIKKQTLGLFLGNEIDIVNAIPPTKDLETAIEYITRNLAHHHLPIQQDRIDDLPYLLGLLIEVKGFNKI